MDWEGSRMSDQAAWPADVVEWATERAGGRSLSEDWERGRCFSAAATSTGSTARHSELPAADGEPASGAAS